MKHVPHPTEARRDLRFGLLGPVSAQRDGTEVPLGGVKQRGILAALLARYGQVASAGALIEDVWGPEAPASAPQMVKVIISRLRAVLGDAAVIRTGQGGYRIDIERDQLDVLQAKAALEDAWSAAVPAEQRAERCARALALWRGEPLADLVGLPLLETVAPPLTELHRSLFDARMAALLEAGAYEQVLIESRAAITQRPFDDTAHGHLMHAMYLAGRQADALGVYADYRARLVDELGVAPGPWLVDLHGRLLRQDPTLRSRVGSAEPREDTEHNDADSPAIRATPSAAVRQSSAEPFRRSRIRRWTIVGIALALTSGTATWAALSGTSGRHGIALRPGVAIRADSVAEFDDGADALLADVPVGAAPGPITVDGGYVWVAQTAQHTVTAISEKEAQPATTYGLPIGPTRLSPGPGAVWVSLGFDGRLARILIASQERTSPFFPDGPIHGFIATVATGGTLWVATSDGRLAQLDSRSMQIRRTLQLGASARDILVDHGTAWSIDRAGPILRRTPLNGVGSERIPLAGNVWSIEAGFGSIWAITTSPNRLVRLSDTGKIQHQYPVAGAATSLCVGSKMVWVAVHSSGMLIRHDPTGARPPAVFDLGLPIGGIACDGQRVWIAFV